MVSQKAKDLVAQALKKAVRYNQDLIFIKTYSICPDCTYPIRGRVKFFTGTTVYTCGNCGLERMELCKRAA